MAEPQFLRTTTILPVNDIRDAAAWYGHALGFETVYVHGDGRRGEARASPTTPSSAATAWRST